MYHDMFGYAAVLIESVAFLMYFRSILEGRTKPKKITWLLWACVALSEIVMGRESSSTINTIFMWGHVFWFSATFLLCLRFGDKGLDKIDWVVIGGLALGLLIWRIYGPQYSFAFMIFVDVLGFVPTMTQASIEPWKEDLPAWWVSWVAAAVNIGSIETGNLIDTGYPVVTLIMVTLVVASLSISPNKRTVTK